MVLTKGTHWDYMMKLILNKRSNNEHKLGYKSVKLVTTEHILMSALIIVSLCKYKEYIHEEIIYVQDLV